MFERYEVVIYNNDNDNEYKNKKVMFLVQARNWVEEQYSKTTTYYQIVRIRDCSVIEIKYLVLDAHPVAENIWWYASRWGNKDEQEHARKENERKLKENKKKHDN